jgi:hypothetical protein
MHLAVSVGHDLQGDKLDGLGDGEVDQDVPSLARLGLTTGVVKASVPGVGWTSRSLSTKPSRSGSTWGVDVQVDVKVSVGVHVAVGVPVR